ncbi:MAG: hypothetical protein ACOYWZ_15015 [Bacillota bacterium]
MGVSIGGGRGGMDDMKRIVLSNIVKNPDVNVNNWVSIIDNVAYKAFAFDYEPCTGIVCAVNGGLCDIITEGNIILSGLISGKSYFLDDVIAGNMTTPCPSTGNVHNIGRAMSDSYFYVDIDHTVLIRT